MVKKLLVSSSPHYRGEANIRSVMGDVLVALFPALIGSGIFFGFRALILAALSVAFSVLFELLFNLVTSKPITAFDLSAAVTGLLIAFCVPVSVPYWMVIAADFFAIVIVKMLFGGLGKNLMNPALSARAFLLSWPVLMSRYTAPFSDISIWNPSAEAIDAVTVATPLSSLAAGTVPDVEMFSLAIGKTAGSIGEVCSILLLLGGCYLLFRKVISWRIPVSFIGTVAVFALIFPRIPDMPLESLFYEVFSGGLILGAFFMATDYVTSPITGRGKLIYGVGCGLLTVFIRYFGGYPEGVTYAVLLMNIFAFSLDKLTRPRRYGTGVENYYVSTRKED